MKLNRYKAYCYTNCQYMTPWECDQRRTRQARGHICARYNEYLTHYVYHPELMRLQQCNYRRSDMKAPTKADLRKKDNMREEIIHQLRQSLCDREVKISELRASKKNDQDAFDIRCAREEQISRDHATAAADYAKECAELKHELGERCKQFHHAMDERNDLKALVNDLEVEINLERDKCTTLRKGIEGRDTAIENAKIKQATADTNGIRLSEQCGHHSDTIYTCQVTIQEKGNEITNLIEEKAVLVAKFEHLNQEYGYLHEGYQKILNLHKNQADTIESFQAGGATSKEQLDILGRENKCNKMLAEEWKDKYEQSQSMVMQLEDNGRDEVKGLTAALETTAAEAQCSDIECGRLTEKCANLQKRLIAKAGQYREVNDQLWGYKEQGKRAESDISELESKCKHIESVLSTVQKSANKNKKYKEFFLMLRELQGVDISITTKTKEVK